MRAKFKRWVKNQSRRNRTPLAKTWQSQICRKYMLNAYNDNPEKVDLDEIFRDMWMLDLEESWLSEPICYAPENLDLIESLRNTHIEGRIDSIRMPTDIVMISMPKGAYFGGKEIMGVLVTFESAEETKRRGERFLKCHSTEYQGETFVIAPAFIAPGAKPNERCLRISIGFNEGNYTELVTPLTTLNKLVSYSTLEEAESKTKCDLSTKKYSDLLSLGDELTRFVLSFLIYIVARPEAVRDADNIRMQGIDRKSKKPQRAIVNGFSGKRLKHHYRQLRHERFYRNQYLDWEVGTRWIPVNMDLKEVEDIRLQKKL